jgi:hypothetical protein
MQQRGEGALMDMAETEIDRLAIQQAKDSQLIIRVTVSLL